ncbi:uncharacterized protein [Aegilops tauschii subsp. strangulata]|uniref:Uncharacterized protein n=4 Tax=Aegilops tauschii subsp. strangulata TaxID=200361 RepID=A0A452ZM28_AEGTS|nr:uncharacterized protein LOC109772365 [Aegilops tauschii subsp. strangulata]
MWRLALRIRPKQAQRHHQTSGLRVPTHPYSSPSEWRTSAIVFCFLLPTMSIPGNGHLPAAASTGLPDHSSDSEAEGDADYLPISGAASDTDSDPDPDPDLASRRRLDAVDNGVSELDLASDDEEEESDEEEGAGATEAAASLDDERRRRAQLPAGAAARIVDAMRGVAFPGAPPPWAGTVPHEQWLERLRSLRGGRD